MEMLPASVSTRSAGQQPETWTWAELSGRPLLSQLSQESEGLAGQSAVRRRETWAGAQWITIAECVAPDLSERWSEGARSLESEPADHAGPGELR